MKLGSGSTGIAIVAVAAAIAGMTGMTGVASGAATTGHGSAPAAAGGFSVGGIGLDSAVVKVTASHGRRLYLLVVSNKHPGVGKAGVTVQLSTSRKFGAGETHTWSFSLKSSVLSYNAATGRGRLSTGKLLKGFGSLKLSFAKTSQSTGRCVPNNPAAGKEIRVKGRLAGKVFFNTQSGTHGWGAVGSHAHKVTFHGANEVVLTETGCPAGFGGGSNACVRGLIWSGPFVSAKGGGTSVEGVVTRTGRRTVSTIIFDRSVTLHHPSGASRTDSLVAKEPAPTVHAGSLSITTSGHLITGSATITDTTSAPNDYACKSGGKTRTEKTVDYTGDWAASHLTANFSATGRATAPATASNTSFITESF
jgi:hypothetical protein